MGPNFSRERADFSLAISGFKDRHEQEPVEPVGRLEG
jgi:hypothetical protein